MNILCITGAPASALQDVNGLLQQAGMALAKGLERQTSLDLAAWHERVLARGQDFDGTPPGRLWDQLAADLFLANIDAPLWGWSNERSTGLLQYWADFEPGVCFVLLCETPQQALARLIVQPEAHTDIAATLRAWQETHRAILRFHLRNPQRSVLLWAAEALQQPAAVLKQLQEQWALPLQAADLSSVRTPAPDALAQYLAQDVAAQYPELETLLHELQASVTQLQPPQASASAIAKTACGAQDLVDAYRLLADRSHEQRALTLLQEQAQLQAGNALRLEQDLELRGAELEQLLARYEEQATLAETRLQQEKHLAQQLTLAVVTVERLEQQVQRLDADKEALLQRGAELAESLEADQLALVHARERSLAAAQQAELFAQQLAHACAERDSQAQGRQRAEAQLFETQEEAELLTLQLRQAQEELEASFHKHAEADKRLAQLQQQLAAEQSSQVQVSAQRDAKRAALTVAQAERDALAAEKTALMAEKAALTAMQEALAVEHQQLLAALDTETQTRGQVIAQQAADARSREMAQTELQEAREEAELLQLQLRQAQEELETYFQKHVDEQEQLKAAQARLQRMLQRHPGYCDFEVLEPLPKRADRAQEAHWRVRGLDAGGRHVKQLDFFTMQHQGVAGIGIERHAGDSSPLMRWPAGVAEGGRLVLMPLGDVTQLKNQVAALMELSTSDWDLLQLLPKLLLAQPGQPAADWTAALQQHRKLMDKWPPALRFDTLQLVREQTNPDYEHLWLRLGNVSFGNQRWPHLEFRLACANTQGGRFGQQPKLEFPMSAQPAFKGWFEESADDFGPKLELRFAMPDSMDRRIWARLPAPDQQLIVALLAVLPRMLGQLPAAGMRTRRAIEQWQMVATHMLRVLRQLTAPARGATPRPVAPAAPAPARLAAVQPVMPESTPVPASAAPATSTAPAPVPRKKASARAKPAAKVAQA